jgi:hypothetical protein
MLAHDTASTYVPSRTCMGRFGRDAHPRRRTARRSPTGRRRAEAARP